MNHRITAVFRDCRRPPGALGLLLVLCLNLTVLPCAMAFGEADDGCPHHQPAKEHTMAGHHGHSEASRPPCATAESSCCDIGAASVDSRGGQFQVKDSDDDRELLPNAFASPLLPPRAASVAIATDPPDPPYSFVPRHVLFCVYLD